MKKHIFFCCMLFLMTSTVLILVAESTLGQALGFTALLISMVASVKISSQPVQRKF